MVQVRFVPHIWFAQQRSPAAPQATHWLALHTADPPVHAPAFVAGQHA
jgi:hypothetical protein